ncbi:flagellar biosynthesis anti-sigma factor FlgM [Clostridium sp. BJN0001]|uniref:flagellar biosynthesis anti-sigma factor FlgM n=1 Tax=Clostridium sp. BJN0001 TaxID=2930219 RepID=UPI001FD56407|nr:flagellar biosynthesis anti-sigma factor FlgM [Clostridium sp. BJN0001]
MNINKIYGASFVNSYNKNVCAKKSTQNENSSKDTIEISNFAKTLSDYKNSNNVNNEKKISEIKDKIKSGTYNVDAKLTAESILKEINKRKGL